MGGEGYTRSKVDTILKKVSIEAMPMLYYLGKYQYSNCIASNPRSFEQWSDTSTFMLKIWIGKAIVAFQTPEFLKVKQYKYFYAKKIESPKWLYCFKPQNF